MTSAFRRPTTAAAVLGAGALVALSGSAPAQATTVAEPDRFTSAFTVTATPDAVVNNDGVATPGEPGATGTFTFRINVDEEIICYDITLRGVTPPYESPARTATHVHQADAGQGGPPRLAFPNPEGDGDTRTSSGCMQGPFTTGLAPEGTDTGAGFSLAAIEANPAGFSADTHTSAFPAGAVRGQLVEVPVGGVDTGAGGSVTEAGGVPVLPLTAAGVMAAGVVGLVAARRLRRDPQA